MLRPSHRTALLIFVLALLYWALVFRKWSSADAVQSLLLPFVLFGLSVGAVLSTMPWVQAKRSVFFISFLIPLTAILFTFLLDVSIPSAMAGGPDINFTTKGAVLFASVSVLVICTFHGLLALAGYALAEWARQTALSAASVDSVNSLTETRLKIVTAFIALVTALIGAFAGR